VDDELDKNGIWLHHLPKWGISFPPILHLILSLAALHLASMEPSTRLGYLSQADNQFTFGVRSVTDILLLLDAENCQLIYISATLICLVYFARGPQPGEFLVFSQTGQSEWLILLRGVRSILSSHRERIFTGVLTPAPDKDLSGVSPELQGELDDHLLHIETVGQWIESQVMDESIRAVYQSALDDLVSMFRQVFEYRSSGKDGLHIMHLVVGWICQLKEEFIVLLEQRDCYALVTFSHWTLLLKYMQSSWLMRGWDEHVAFGVKSCLREDLHGWIEWPLRNILEPARGA
jgi:hypothetical protein